MLNQAFATTLKILLFRAGPEDFPYSEDPALSRACIAISVLASAAMFGASATPLLALAAGGVATAGASMFVRTTLRLRGLDSRFQQTRNALLATTSVLLLMMLWPTLAMLPAINAFLETVKTAQQAQPDPAVVVLPPDKLPELPAGPSMLLNILTLWFYFQTAHILRRAADLGAVLSGLLATLCIFNVLLLALFSAQLLAPILG